MKRGINMAQQIHQIVEPCATFAKSLLVNTGSSETIVLDQIPVLGLRNIGITIVNHSGSSSACALYGSPDGSSWLAVSGFSSFAVSTSGINHSEVSCIFQYLRLTITGTSVVDAYLYAIQS
jgi:hypothetical protein